MKRIKGTVKNCVVFLDNIRNGCQVISVVIRHSIGIQSICRCMLTCCGIVHHSSTWQRT